MSKKAGLKTVLIFFTDEEHKLLSNIKKAEKYSWHDLIVDKILNQEEDKNGNE